MSPPPPSSSTSSTSFVEDVYDVHDILAELEKFPQRRKHQQCHQEEWMMVLRRQTRCVLKKRSSAAIWRQRRYQQEHPELNLPSSLFSLQLFQKSSVAMKKSEKESDGQRAEDEPTTNSERRKRKRGRGNTAIIKPNVRNQTDSTMDLTSLSKETILEVFDLKAELESVEARMMQCKKEQRAEPPRKDDDVTPTAQSKEQQLIPPTAAKVTNDVPPSDSKIQQKQAPKTDEASKKQQQRLAAITERKHATRARTRANKLAVQPEPQQILKTPPAKNPSIASSDDLMITPEAATARVPIAAITKTPTTSSSQPNEVPALVRNNENKGTKLLSSPLAYRKRPRRLSTPPTVTTTEYDVGDDEDDTASHSNTATTATAAVTSDIETPHQLDVELPAQPPRPLPKIRPSQKRTMRGKGTWAFGMVHKVSKRKSKRHLVEDDIFVFKSDEERLNQELYGSRTKQRRILITPREDEEDEDESNTNEDVEYDGDGDDNDEKSLILFKKPHVARKRHYRPPQRRRQPHYKVKRSLKRYSRDTKGKTTAMKMGTSSLVALRKDGPSSLTQTRTLSPQPDVCIKGQGLISGFKDVNSLITTDGYTNQLEVWPGLHQPSLFWGAVQQDAKEAGEGHDVVAYLDTLVKRSYRFCRSNRVAGRQKLQTTLKQFVDSGRMGQILVVSGGKRNGKSKLLQRTCQYGFSDALVAYVNGREATVADGLASALGAMEKQGLLSNVCWTSIMTTMFPLEKTCHVNFTSVIKGVLEGTQDVDANLVKMFVVIAEQVGKLPYLIIDEAEEVFLNGHVNRQLVNTLTHITKSTMRLSILLGSSHPWFRSDLVDRLPPYLVDLLYVPELAPKEMWDLLVLDKDDSTGKPLVGMGQHLAELSIAAFGGNVALLDDALNKLVESRDEFLPFQQLWKQDGAMSVKRLLEEEDAEVVRMLRKLSTQGYLWPENYTANSIEIIEKALVGCTIFHTNDYPLQLPLSQSQQSRMSVLVPSCQSIRHVIAHQLRLVERRKRMAKLGLDEK